MKSNISVLNAMMRITCGFTALAWATSRMVRRPHRLGFLFVAMMGAMKVAEGFFRYCPATAVLKNSGMSSKEQPGSGDDGNKKERKRSSDDMDKE